MKTLLSIKSFREYHSKETSWSQHKVKFEIASNGTTMKVSPYEGQKEGNKSVTGEYRMLNINL